MSGWIKVYRQMVEDGVYFSEKFTRFQAWLDLLLLAEYKPRTLYIRGNKIELKRGQLAVSIRTLSNRWQWGVNKVQSFLTDTQNAGKIDIQNNNIVNIITVCKYDIYQQTDTQIDTQIDTQTDTQIDTQTDTQIDTQKSVTILTYNKLQAPKNIKKIKNNIIESSLHSDSKSKIKISDSRPMSEVVKSLVGYFNLKMDAKEIPRIHKLGERRRQFLEARLKEYGEVEVRRAIDNAAESVFLNGGNHRGFIASFEWIFRPNNFPKVLEGNYKNNNNFYAYQASDQSATQRLNEAAGIVKRLLAEDDARGDRQEELPY